MFKAIVGDFKVEKEWTFGKNVVKIEIMVRPLKSIWIDELLLECV